VGRLRPPAPAAGPGSAHGHSAPTESRSYSPRPHAAIPLVHDLRPGGLPGRRADAARSLAHRPAQLLYLRRVGVRRTAGDRAAGAHPGAGTGADVARDGRVAYKHRKQTTAGLRGASFDQRLTALKWCVVASLGYLGYIDDRFGRMEAHEAVTAFAGEMLLRAKEVAEALGFRMLHALV